MHHEAENELPLKTLVVGGGGGLCVDTCTEAPALPPTALLATTQTSQPDPAGKPVKVKLVEPVEADNPPVKE